MKKSNQINQRATLHNGLGRTEEGVVTFSKILQRIVSRCNDWRKWINMKKIIKLIEINIV